MIALINQNVYGKLDSGSIGFHRVIARCYFSLGDMEKTEKFALDALKLEPESASKPKLNCQQLGGHYVLFKVALQRNDDKKG
jgi:hypothetical protein